MVLMAVLLKGMFCLLFLGYFMSVAIADCYDAESEASDAYSYARKAYRSDTIDDCQRYARRARSAASNAESEASYCN